MKLWPQLSSSKPPAAACGADEEWNGLCWQLGTPFQRKQKVLLPLLPRSYLTSLWNADGGKRHGEITSQEDLFLLVPARPPQSLSDSSSSLLWMIDSTFANRVLCVSTEPRALGAVTALDRGYKWAVCPESFHLAITACFRSLSSKGDFYVSTFLFSIALNKIGPSPAHGQHSVFSSFLGDFWVF